MNFRHADVVVNSSKMDFQSAMETFAEAWAAANTVKSEVPNDLSQVRNDLFFFLNNDVVIYIQKVKINFFD